MKVSQPVEFRKNLVSNINKIIKTNYKMENKYQNLKQLVKTSPALSTWHRAIRCYAIELLQNLKEQNPETVKCFEEGTPIKEKHLLNGADSWMDYSEAGSSLIYNYDIAERVCTPSEFKKTREGEKNPSKNEDWMQCQARALSQAALLINLNQFNC